MLQDPADRLDEARQHLAEASDHIAAAVQQLALEERAAARLGTGGAERQLHRRKDGLALTYRRLQQIKDELQTLDAAGVAR